MTPTLLLADDSVTIQRVIELTFANEDVRVVSTSDGEAALRHIDTERPDIVLADVGMPKRDGYDVASHIKNTPALHDIPVLLLTGAFEPLDESRARASGCDGILVKPFEPQQLVGRVKELLAGQHTPALWPAGVPKVEETPPPPVRPALRIAPKPEPAFPPATSALWPVAVPAAAPRPVSVPAHVAASTAAPHPSRLPDVGETFQHEFEQLDAVFAGLDPEATPGLNEESARDFARDLDVRPIAEPAAATRPFGDWDLPSPPPQADPVPSGPLGGAVSGTWDSQRERGCRTGRQTEGDVQARLARGLAAARSRAPLQRRLRRMLLSRKPFAECWRE